MSKRLPLLEPEMLALLMGKGTMETDRLRYPLRYWSGGAVMTGINRRRGSGDAETQARVVVCLASRSLPEGCGIVGALMEVGERSTV